MQKAIQFLTLLVFTASADFAGADACDKERNKLIDCRTIKHVGSSCPKNTKALKGCEARHGLKSTVSTIPIGIQLPEVAPIPLPRIQRDRQDMPPVPPEAQAAASDETSSEVTGGENSTAYGPHELVIKDIPQCAYHQGSRTLSTSDCWEGLSLSDRIQKIVSNVNYLNRMHDSHINPAYLLCTGWRESMYDPGAMGTSKDTGLFQVIPSTAKAAVRGTNSVLPGFKNLKGDEYRKQMVTSTLAMTEMTMMVIFMKINEAKKSLGPISIGTATSETYKELAWRYVGKNSTDHSLTYRNSIYNCYKCITDDNPDLMKNADYDSDTMRSCLSKARGGSKDLLWKF